MKHRIKITTLSPVCIGSGQKLSPIADYIYDNKQIHYLNKAKIEEVLAQDSDLMDKYIQGIVYGMDNNKTNFPLKEFLENSLKLSPNEYILHSVDANISSAKELNAIIKNASDNRPYIPGSSLKGAIKTTFLYDWLKKENNHWCKDFLTNQDNKDLKNKLKNKLDNQLKSYELSVRDSDAFPIGKVIENKRLNLKTGSKDIPTTWESIDENQSCETEIMNIQHIGENQYQKFSWEETCRIINRYTLHQNSVELDLLENIGNENIDRSTYKEILNFCDNLYEEIKNATDTAYLRLGNGKGFFFNSVGLALYDADGNDKQKFLKHLKKEYKKVKNPDEFPITRVIDVSENRPLGWIKLELIK